MSSITTRLRNIATRFVTGSLACRQLGGRFARLRLLNVPIWLDRRIRRAVKRIAFETGGRYNSANTCLFSYMCQDVADTHCLSSFLDLEELVSSRKFRVLTVKPRRGDREEIRSSSTIHSMRCGSHATRPSLAACLPAIRAGKSTARKETSKLSSTRWVSFASSRSILSE